MFVCLRMVINGDFIPLKVGFLEHVREEVLINIVIEIGDGQFHCWWLSHIVLVNCEPIKRVVSDNAS